MSNFPKLSPALSQRNKNGFAEFTLPRSSTVWVSTPAWAASKGAAAEPPHASSAWFESHPQSAQQPAPTAPHAGETKLTVHNSPSPEINLCNKVRLLRSTVPRNGILSNSCNSFLHGIMEECVREWSLDPEAWRKLRKDSTQWKKVFSEWQSIKASASFEGHSLGLDYLAVNLKDLHREQLSCCPHCRTIPLMLITTSDLSWVTWNKTSLGP